MTSKVQPRALPKEFRQWCLAYETGTELGARLPQVDEDFVLLIMYFGRELKQTPRPVRPPYGPEVLSANPWFRTLRPVPSSFSNDRELFQTLVGHVLEEAWNKLRHMKDMELKVTIGDPSHPPLPFRYPNEYEMDDEAEKRFEYSDANTLVLDFGEKVLSTYRSLAEYDILFVHVGALQYVPLLVIALRRFKAQAMLELSSLLFSSGPLDLPPGTVVELACVFSTATFCIELSALRAFSSVSQGTSDMIRTAGRSLSPSPPALPIHPSISRQLDQKTRAFAMACASPRQFTFIEDNLENEVNLREIVNELLDPAVLPIEAVTRVLCIAPTNAAINDLALSFVRDCSTNQLYRHGNPRSIMDREEVYPEYKPILPIFGEHRVKDMRDALDQERQALLEKQAEIDAELHSVASWDGSNDAAEKRETTLHQKRAEHDPDIKRLDEILDSSRLVKQEVWKTTRVAFSTFPKSASLLRERPFDVVIIFDAGGATEASFLVPVVNGSNARFVVIGSHYEKPRVKAPESVRLGYRRSFFARYLENGSPAPFPPAS